MSHKYWANPAKSVTCTLRMPKSLRVFLEEQARSAGVSLNRFLIDILEKSPGAMRAAEPREWKCCICNYRYCEAQADNAACSNCGNRTIEPVLFA